MSKPTVITQTLSGPLQEEGYKLMAAVFEVHKEVGGGLSEAIYQECLLHELEARLIPYEADPEVSLQYKGLELQARHVADLLAYGSIVVMIRTVYQLLPEHEASLLSFMRLSQKRVGYLLNMAPAKKVEWRRYVQDQPGEQPSGPTS